MQEPLERGTMLEFPVRVERNAPTSLQAQLTEQLRRAILDGRLAAGMRGPVRHPEFLLQAMMAYLQSGVGAAAAVVSLLWWVRIRGAIALLFWLLFAVARIGSELLPLHPDLAMTDPVWRSEARRLDSIAFGMTPREYDPARLPAAPAIVPSLWDDSVAARAEAFLC